MTTKLKPNIIDCQRGIRGVTDPHNGVMKSYGKDVYEAYVHGYSEAGRNYGGETVFFYGNTIYSYGYHFPMAVRMVTPGYGTWYLVNGDVYSNTTNRHQAELRNALDGKRTIILPFSVLEEAKIDVSRLELVDVERSQNVDVVRHVKNRETGKLERKVVPVHLLGSAVFKAPYVKETVIPDEKRSEVDHWRTDQVFEDNGWTRRTLKQEVKTGYLISGLDATGTDPWKSYFLSVLPHAVTTVAEAYDALKPQPVLDAEAAGIDVFRQGEYFFVPVEDDAGYNGQAKKWEAIQSRAGRTNNHIAANYVKVRRQQFAKGYVRHADKEHKQLHLKGWHEVFENTAIRSWSTGGKVD